MEVGISHSEGGVSSSGLAFLDGALAILEVDLVNNFDFAALGLGDLECIDSIDLGNEVLSETLTEVGVHHAKKIVSLEVISGEL